MPFSRSSATRRAPAVVLAAAVVAVAGCGASKAEISRAEKALNAELKKQGLPVTVACPKEVSASEEFDCDVESTKNDTSRKVKFELAGRKDEALNVAGQQDWEKALLAAGS